MKKILFLLFLINVYLIPIHSQTTDEREVDTVKISCMYRQLCVVDTLSPKKKTNDLMLLQIGNHLSKYYSFSDYLADSVTRILAKNYYMGQQLSPQDVITEYQKLPRNSRASDFQIFKHYPQKGQLTFYQYFGLESNLYEETMPDFQWKLSNDTLIVCGYLCRKATTSFRGRNYTVWYTREIPVSDGPWKFNGLPGLILKAIDEQEFFSFECTAVEILSGIKPIDYFINTNSKKKISRKEFNKAMQRHMDNPGAYASGSPLIQDALPASAYKKRPYNPIERTDE